MNRAVPLAVLLALAAPAIASADTVSDRQARQAARIEHGRQTGSITWLEGIQLRKQQTRIERTKEALEADGHLSRNDRRTLAAMQNDASDNIYAESHDRRHRLWGLPRVGR